MLGGLRPPNPPNHCLTSYLAFQLSSNVFNIFWKTCCQEVLKTSLQKASNLQWDFLDFGKLETRFRVMLEARGPILEARGPMWRISKIVVIFKTLPVRKTIPFWAPCWAQVGAKFELSWTIFIKKVFQNTLGKHLAFEHRFFNEHGSPRTPPDI